MIDLAPKEQLQALPIDVQGFRRFVWDLRGVSSLSLQEIDSVRDRAKPIHDDLKVHYYREREDGMRNMMRVATERHKLLKELGVHQDPSHPLQ